MTSIREENLHDIALDATERLRNISKESLQANLDLSYNALVLGLEDDIAKLPEYIFVNRFLPFFSGQVPLENYPNLFIDWIAIAGAPNREVAIVDNNGNELFRVPPIMNTGIIKLNGENNLNEIFEEYELRNNHIPALGQNFLAYAMLTKSEEVIKENKDLTDKEKAWISIFERYNIETIKKETKPNQNTYVVDDDLEYE